MVKHIQTIRRQFADELLSVFDYFVGFALKALSRWATHKATRTQSFLY